MIQKPDEQMVEVTCVRCGGSGKSGLRGMRERPKCTRCDGLGKRWHKPGSRKKK